MMPWLSLTLQIDAAVAERFTQALLDARAQAVSLENPQAGLQAVGALVGTNVDAGALVRDAASAAGLAAPWFGSTPGWRSARAAIPPRDSCCAFSSGNCGAARASSTTVAGRVYWRSPRQSSARRGSTQSISIRRRSPEGRIALAGVLEAQAFEVAARYTAWFDVGMSSIDEGWGS